MTQTISPENPARLSLDDLFSCGLEQLLQSAIQTNLLAGLVVGVIRDGDSQIRISGSGLAAESYFEIGSMTKLYTVELLDILVRRGVLGWNDPVSRYLSEYLSNCVQSSSRRRPVVTLLDLASHTSGLPLLPPNLRIVNGSHPFADYSSIDLEGYLEEADLSKPQKPVFVYSNLGYALLGYVMEQATQRSYEDLLYKELLAPLGLHNTFLSLTGREAQHSTDGHTQAGLPTPAWTQRAFAPAGALCSTAADQLRFLKVLLDNPKRRAFGYEDNRLNTQLTLGWRLHSLANIYCRDGVTGGFCSYISINPSQRSGLVLLTNRKCLFLLRALAYNCERSLRGLPLIPLAGDYGLFRADILDLIRRGKRTSYVLSIIRGQKQGAYLLEMLRRCFE